jgi:ATP-dependent helicase/nuclease subunit A
VLRTSGRSWRPARLSDVTVLIPTRTELPALRAALADLDLPYHLATGTLVFASQEVRDALAALRAIDDPSDELSLVAALRSPLYACNDVHLAEFRGAGGRWDLRSDAASVVDASHPVAGALAHLRGLWERRWWVRPADLLATLLHERRASIVAFGSDRPAEAWGRLRYLLDQTRHFEESGGGDLRAFLQWADLQRSETITAHQPVAVDGSAEVVSIMTIHGAKGLEFPITILSGLSARPQTDRGASVIFGDDGLPGVALKKGRATRDHGDLVEVERQISEHEQLRLLYVACTRARDHLVVSAHHAPRGRLAPFARLVWETSGRIESTWRRLDPLATRSHLGQPTPTPPANVPDPAERQAWAAARHDLLEGQASSRVRSATAVARSVSGHELAGEDDDTAAEVDGAEPPIPTASRRRGRAGTAIGRAVHATLQVVDLHDPHDLDAEAQRQAHIETIPEHAGTVAAMVRSALAAPTISDARAYHREVYVAAPVGDQVLEGYVDLLVETPDGLVVVDYKTDTVRSETDLDQKLAAYELQGAAYAVALETATGLPVVACRFVFCRPAGAIEREVADLPTAMARVRAAMAGPPDPVQIAGSGGSQ